MVIPAERALSIFEFYRRRGTRLELTGRILGEIAAGFARITRVEANPPSVSITVSGEDDRLSWDRSIPLHRATFFYTELREHSFAAHVAIAWRSVLHVEFPDGTTMFFSQSSVHPDEASHPPKTPLPSGP